MHFDLFDLTGRTALITGSSLGIGFALAKGLAAHGAAVVVNGRDEARAEAAARAIREAGGEVVVSCFDVTDAEAVNAAIADIEAQRPIDILVNNAGMQFRTPLQDFPDDKWELLLKTNVTSAYLVGKAVAHRMIARGAGKIINIASVQSELARPGIAPYTATKGAIRNLTKGMATDWARHNIQANAIAPGYFKTPLNQALVDDPAFTAWLEKRTPAGRWGEVEELIAAAVFLAGKGSSFINGHTLYVDGGITASI
ncbi:SDR family oxidoreductase [Chelativorans salis]|uniref:SDR family oxidoreductase n=1 Tax=Chelativorans salis TaxID=2978478 RepID=A0ABT2LWN8_9HYPH|nr:SDR family oxidoreductase [Chelativorans sp. EGI FJ00035]MCT7378013.1 SDR family oxidoreductase [Chelativorans sp. EGI FJ00035]